MRKVILFIIQLVLIFGKPLLSQEKPVIFNHLNEENGLPTIDITNDLLFDSYGMIWITTREGLVRYSGSAVKVFTSQRGNANSLPTNDVVHIAETKDKRLLIGTTNGFCAYDFLTERFKQYPKNNDNPELGPSNNYITGIDPEFNDRYWIKSQASFSLYDANTEKFRHFSSIEGYGDYFEKLTNHEIYLGKDNKFYLKILFDHIYLWENDTWKQLPVDTENDGVIYVNRQGLILYGNERLMVYDPSSGAAPSEWRFTNSNIKGIKEDHLGNVWMATQTEGIYIIQPRDRLILNHYTTNSTPPLPSNNFETVVATKDRLFFLLGKSEGVMIYNYDEGTFRKFKNDPTDPLSVSPLTSASVRVSQDHSGVYWLHSEGVDLNYFDFKQTKFSIIRNKPTDPFPMKGAVNRGVFASNHTSVWLGNNTALYRYDRVRNSFSAYASEIVNSILAEDENDVWVGSVTLRNYRYNQGDGSMKLIYDYRPEEGNQDKLPYWYVTYLKRTRDDTLWVCCTGGLGKLINKANGPNTEKFFAYRHNPNDSTTLPSNIPWHIHEDEKGLLWVSTINGLGVLNRKTGKFKQYKYNTKDPGSISTDNIKFVEQDHHGRYWVATEGGGLCLLDEKTDKFTTFTTNDGLPTNTIYSILKDNNNRFWMSTKRGISSFHPDSMVFTNYYVTDGLQGNGFNIQSFWKNETTGEMLFGGSGGFNIFHPDSLAKSTFQPPLYITNLKISNHTIVPGKVEGQRQILEKTILETEKIKLRYNENSIYFEFAALHYSAPENIIYQYRLEGFDEQWIRTTNKLPFANYTNLSPGRYTFRLKATNCDGIWMDYERTLSVYIRPPFWKTWWFYLALAIAIFMGIRGFMMFRERQLRLDKLKLQRQLEQGKKEIEEKIKEVEQHEEEIRRRDIAEQEQKWHNQGMVKFTDILSRNKENINELLNKVLNQLIDYLGADTGAVFLFEENENDPENSNLIMAESYGLNREALQQTTFLPGESLVGACFKDRATKVITDIPEKYVKISSSIGELKPKTLLLVPIQQEDLILGVIEIGLLTDIEPYKVHFVEKLAESVAGYIFITRSSQKLKELIYRANIQSEEMKAQEEELRQNLEEMHATQEEAHRREQMLVEQAKAFAEKEAELLRQIKEVKAKYAKPDKKS